MSYCRGVLLVDTFLLFLVFLPFISYALRCPYCVHICIEIFVLGFFFFAAFDFYVFGSQLWRRVVVVCFLHVVSRITAAMFYDGPPPGTFAGTPFGRSFRVPPVLLESHIVLTVPFLRMSPFRLLLCC